MNNVTIKEIMTGKLLEKRLDEIQGNMLDFALMLTADAGVADRLVKESVSRVLESGYCSDDRGVRFKSRVYVIMREVFDEKYGCQDRDDIKDATGSLYQVETIDESEELIEHSLSSGEVGDIIASLSPDVRESYVLHITGCRRREIARRLQMPYIRVVRCIFIGRTAVRKYLEGRCG